MTAININTDGCCEKAKIIRSMVEHENMLYNHRMNWMLTTQGFLLTIVGVLWNKNGQEIIVLISILGILSLFSFWYTLRTNRWAITNLIENYEHYNPPVIGKAKDKVEILHIWNFLPLILVIFWIVIFIKMK